MTLQLNLGKYLKQHDISAYRLVQAARGQVAPTTVYDLARGPVERVNLRTVSQLLEALSRVRGQKVAYTEIFEEVTEAAEEPTAPPTLEQLLAQVLLPDLTTAQKFSYSGKGKRADISGGPSIADVISEGRDR